MSIYQTSLVSFDEYYEFLKLCVAAFKGRRDTDVDEYNRIDAGGFLFDIKSVEKWSGQHYQKDGDLDFKVPVYSDKGYYFEGYMKIPELTVKAVREGIELWVVSHVIGS